MIRSHRFALTLILASTGALAYAGCGGSSEDNPAAPTTGADASTPTPTPTPTDAGPRVCTGGKTLCSDNCVDTQLDRENCGGCGKGCGPSEVCSQGQCGLTCGGGTTKCGTGCVDTKTDEKNCGGCNNTCGTGQTCQAGADGGAACVCAVGLTNCGGSCVDTQNDDAHCGGCTPCGAGQECVAGTCKGAISAWRFEDDLNDVSAKNNGTAQGAPTFEAPSWSQNAGKALRLNGSSAVAVAAPVDLPLGNAPRTIEAWVRASAFPDGTYNGILSYGTRACGSGQLLSMANNYAATSANWCNDLLQTNVATRFLAQSWSHVAFTWDGTMRRLYIDGREVASDSPLAFDTLAGELRIGATDLANRYFNGWIDDVKIYDYARSPSQLAKTVGQDVAYAFTAATDTTDSGPNKVSAGTKAGGVTATADRKNAADSAIALDGQAGTSFQIYPVPSLGKDRPYTIAAWVKPAAAQAGTIVHVSSEQNGAGGGWCISALGLNASGHPVVTSWAPGTTALVADDPVAGGTWTHIAVSWSRSSLKLYVDGVLKKSFQQGAFAASSRPMYVTLGTANTGTSCSGHGAMNGNYAGAIDDFKVWDRELSAAEIANEAK